MREYGPETHAVARQIFVQEHAPPDIAAREAVGQTWRPSLTVRLGRYVGLSAPAYTRTDFSFLNR